MNKAAIVSAIIEAITAEFNTLQTTSQKTRAAGNDAESRAEGKYDTRSTEDNYLADGLARQAHSAAEAAVSYQNFNPPEFGSRSPIDIGALVQIGFPEGSHWFFIGPAGGGVEVCIDGVQITVLTQESPLGRQLIGQKAGGFTASPKAKIRCVE